MAEYRVNGSNSSGVKGEANNLPILQPKTRKPSEINIPIGGNQAGAFVAVNNTSKLPGLLSGTEKC